jgi:hypothetical protein
MTVFLIINGPTHEVALVAGKDFGRRTPESGIFSLAHEMETHETVLIHNFYIIGTLDEKYLARVRPF